MKDLNQNSSKFKKVQNKSKKIKCQKSSKSKDLNQATSTNKNQI